jgi:hypothetical protein
MNTGSTRTVITENNESLMSNLLPQYIDIVCCWKELNLRKPFIMKYQHIFYLLLFSTALENTTSSKLR